MVLEKFERRSLDQPDETRTFENGKAQVVTLGNFSASRLVFEPGWRWEVSSRVVDCSLITRRPSRFLLPTPRF